jgi:hypothetical protein
MGSLTFIPFTTNKLGLVQRLLVPSPKPINANLEMSTIILNNSKVVIGVSGFDPQAYPFPSHVPMSSCKLLSWLEASRGP